MNSVDPEFWSRGARAKYITSNVIGIMQGGETYQSQQRVSATEHVMKKVFL